MSWRLDSGVVGEGRLVAQHRPGADDRVAADVTMAPENRAADGGLLADPGARPHDRLFDHRVFVHVTRPSDHAIGADAGPGLDDRAFVDETRTLEHRSLFDARARRHMH